MFDGQLVSQRARRVEDVHGAGAQTCYHKKPMIHRRTRWCALLLESPFISPLRTSRGMKAQLSDLVSPLAHPVSLGTRLSITAPE
jgi:hypothetical protein